MKGQANNPRQPGPDGVDPLAGADGDLGSGLADRPLRVVVADDHPMWRDAVARDLVDAGFSVVGTAADGPSAVSRPWRRHQMCWSWTSTCPACEGRPSAPS